MIVTQEEVDDAVLNITSGKDWDILVQALNNEIYAIQTNIFNARDWGDFKEGKGYARGLAYVINLRETTVQVQAQEKANADL